MKRRLQSRSLLRICSVFEKRSLRDIFQAEKQKNGKNGEKNEKKSKKRFAKAKYAGYIIHMFAYHTVETVSAMCSGGGTGRRVWLRSIWSDPWGFESPLEYHFFE